ncbi:hypothetical protein T484DRAFT_1788760 [Baffinella frigidus]|nr:hypothetical protein T484DRAFT_1788760 [Cryptophyta sp. CCMP2293]
MAKERPGVPWDHVDPDSVVPALPMPFRMIDHLIRGLVEEALDLARDVATASGFSPALTWFAPQVVEEDTGPSPLAETYTFSDMPGVTCVTASPDGLFLSGAVHVCNCLRGEILGTVEVEEPVSTLALGTGAQVLTVACSTKLAMFHVLTVACTTKLAMFHVVRAAPYLSKTAELPYAGPASSAAFSFDDQTLGVVREGGGVDVWRLPAPPKPHEEKDEDEGGAVVANAADAAPAEPEITPMRMMTTAARKGAPSIFLTVTPKPRQVGSLGESECAHVCIPYIGASIMAKFRN